MMTVTSGITRTVCLCQTLFTIIYKNVSWICTNCGIPNFSSSLFNSFIHETSNTFSVFYESTVSTNPGSPMHCSSPKHAKDPPKAVSNDIRTLVVNFQSVKNKIPQLANLIDTSHPDIILGSETWLNSNIQSSEIFTQSIQSNVAIGKMVMAVIWLQ